ncbi:MAG: hypothetical protein K2O32_00310 [Acetatifactor sp.]|nr:hypothetical protein [Acetatifactor sp.]
MTEELPDYNTQKTTAVDGPLPYAAVCYFMVLPNNPLWSFTRQGMILKLSTKIIAIHRKLTTTYRDSVEQIKFIKEDEHPCDRKKYFRA